MKDETGRAFWVAYSLTGRVYCDCDNERPGELGLVKLSMVGELEPPCATIVLAPCHVCQETVKHSIQPVLDTKYRGERYSDAAATV